MNDWSAGFREYGPKLVLFARQWTDSHTEAEDVVQEAFVRILRRNPPSVDDPAAYLHICVRNVALEFHRTNRRRLGRERQVAQHYQPNEPLFESPAESVERRSILENAMCQLPAAQREVLVMKIWGELSFVQIADVLDLSPNTIASRYRYALIALRKTLAKKESVL